MCCSWQMKMDNAKPIMVTISACTHANGKAGEMVHGYGVASQRGAESVLWEATLTRPGVLNLFIYKDLPVDVWDTIESRVKSLLSAELQRFSLT